MPCRVEILHWTANDEKERKKFWMDGWMNRWKIFLYIYFILLLLFSTLSSVASMESLLWNWNWKLINWFKEKKKFNEYQWAFCLEFDYNFSFLCVCIVNLRRFSSIVIMFLTTKKCLIKFNEFNESKKLKWIVTEFFFHTNDKYLSQ